MLTIVFYVIITMFYCIKIDSLHCYDNPSKSVYYKNICYAIDNFNILKFDNCELENSIMSENLYVTLAVLCT